MLFLILISYTCFNQYRSDEIKNKDFSVILIEQNKINYFKRYSISNNENNNNKLGIYMGEFLISSIPPLVSTIYINMEMIFSDEKFKSYRSIYLISSTSFSPMLSCLSGEIFNETGSFWKSLVGSAVGSLLGLAITECTIDHIDSKIILADFYLTFFPALGATIGYNL